MRCAPFSPNTWFELCRQDPYTAQTNLVMHAHLVRADKVNERAGCAARHALETCESQGSDVDLFVPGLGTGHEIDDP